MIIQRLLQRFKLPKRFVLKGTHAEVATGDS